MQLDWDGLAHLKKALPVIARLKSGQCMVVLRVAGEDEAGKTVQVVLQDPNAHEDAPLVIDRVRFEEAWTGDIILVKRNYDIADETQPFGFGFIVASALSRTLDRPRCRDLRAGPGVHFTYTNPVLAGAVRQGALLQGVRHVLRDLYRHGGLYRVRDRVRLAAAISGAVYDVAGRRKISTTYSPK